MVLVNINHKGGVGKTTNTIHIGAELVNRKKKVLLIDCDNQCDLTSGVGINESEYDIIDFLGRKKEMEISLISDNFHIIAGNLDFQSGNYQRDELIKSIKFYGLDNLYDFILIDVPPTGINSNMVSPAELALCAADFIIIPLQADKFSIKNVLGFITRVMEIAKYNPKMKILGMYFTNILTTTSVFTEYYNGLKEQQGEFVFDTFIRRDMEVVKAAMAGMTIFEYNDKCRASEDFKDLVTEILKKIKKWQKQ